MADLLQYLPRLYDNNIHMKTIAGAGESVLNDFEKLSAEEKANLFVITTTLTGIKRYEDILKITANPATESLEFRQQRVLSRYSMSPPFSMEYLEEKLNSIIGEGKWVAKLNSDDYTLYIESSAENQAWYNEVLVTINKIKPVNIVYINVPTMLSQISVSEEIGAHRLNWNYALGTTWNLGSKPFVSYIDIGGIKMAQTPSIQTHLLNDLATFTKDDIASVRLNNTYKISTFDNKAITDNVVTVEYTVPTESGLTTVTQVELLDAEENVLTRAAVYVPLPEDVLLKHTLVVKEA